MKDPNENGAKDRIRIDIYQENELDYRMAKFETRDELRAVFKHAGSEASEVEKLLNSRRKNIKYVCYGKPAYWELAQSMFVKQFMLPNLFPFSRINRFMKLIRLDSKMRYTIVLFIMGWITALGQTDQDVLTTGENLRWLDAFNQERTAKGKLKLITSKIYDELEYVIPMRACMVFVEETARYKHLKRKKYECKIPFFLFVNGRYFQLDPRTSDLAIFILQRTTDADIEKFDFLRGPHAAALYGSQGSCGAITIHSKSERLEFIIDEFNDKLENR